MSSLGKQARAHHLSMRHNRDIGLHEELHSEGTACGHAGGAIVTIVTTEHLRFAEIGSADPNAMLFAALQDKQVCILSVFQSGCSHCLSSLVSFNLTGHSSCAFRGLSGCAGTCLRLSVCVF